MVVPVHLKAVALVVVVIIVVVIVVIVTVIVVVPHLLHYFTAMCFKSLTHIPLETFPC